MDSSRTLLASTRGNSIPIALNDDLYDLHLISCAHFMIRRFFKSRGWTTNFPKKNPIYQIYRVNFFFQIRILLVCNVRRCVRWRTISLVIVVACWIPQHQQHVQLLNREKVVMGTLGHLHNNSARGYLFYYLVLLVHLPPLCLSSWGLTLEFWTYVLVHNILHKRICKFSTSCNQSLSRLS